MFETKSCHMKIKYDKVQSGRCHIQIFSYHCKLSGKSFVSKESSFALTESDIRSTIYKIIRGTVAKWIFSRYFEGNAALYLIHIN